MPPITVFSASGASIGTTRRGRSATPSTGAFGGAENGRRHDKTPCRRDAVVLVARRSSDCRFVASPAPPVAKLGRNTALRSPARPGRPVAQQGQAVAAGDIPLATARRLGWSSQRLQPPARLHFCGPPRTVERNLCAVLCADSAECSVSSAIFDHLRTENTSI